MNFLPPTTVRDSSSSSASASSSQGFALPGLFVLLPPPQLLNPRAFRRIRSRSFHHSKTHRSLSFNSIHEHLERSWHDLGSLPSAPALLRNHFQFCCGQINLMCPRVQRHRARSRLSFQRLNNRQFLGRIL